MAIFPEHRGKGFAGQLLSKAESVAKASGTNRIALQVEEVNNVAFGFYQKNGYVEVAVSLAMAMLKSMMVSRCNKEATRAWISLPGTDVNLLSRAQRL